MSLPQGGFGSSRGPRRRRTVLLCLAALLLCLAYGYVVLSWQIVAGEEARSAKPATTQTTDDAQAAGQHKDAPSASSNPAAPPTSGQQTPAAGDAYDDAQPERRPVSEEASHDRAHDHPHPEGATNEPGSYDPLGTGAEPGDLTPTDAARARFAAASFVAAAYGYTGDEKDAYLAGVYRAALSPDFARSEGGEEISRYARQVEETGTKSAARLTRFEVTETRPGAVEGRAYFETGEAYDGTQLAGERRAYRQGLTLARVGAAWKVQSAGKVEEAR